MTAGKETTKGERGARGERGGEDERGRGDRRGGGHDGYRPEEPDTHGEFPRPSSRLERQDKFAGKRAIGPPLAKATAGGFFFFYIILYFSPGRDQPNWVGFGCFFDPRATGYSDPLLVARTTGSAPKLESSRIEHDRHDSVGIDLVAMCVNDLIVQGGRAYCSSSTISPPASWRTGLPERVIAGIAERGCKTAGCALIGGETAEMQGMYAPGDYDPAGFSSVRSSATSN